jgi:uncharacterized membrane protein (DUF485 family)
VQGEGDILRGGSSAASVPWREIAESPQFAELEALRRRFTFTLLGVFTAAVGTFLILCAYARPFMRTSIDGGLTVAYVWLLALTVLAWVLVWTYLRFSERRLEPLAARIVERAGNGPGDSPRSRSETEAA